MKTVIEKYQGKFFKAVVFDDDGEFPAVGDQPLCEPSNKKGRPWGDEAPGLLFLEEGLCTRSQAESLRLHHHREEIPLALLREMGEALKR